MKTFFDESEFTATKFNTAKDKADFGNKLLHLILSDFQERLCTHSIYDRLNGSFGHIAHGDLAGFYDHWFSTLDKRVAFLANVLEWPCWGQPEHTFCDVERTVQRKVRDLRLLETWQDRAEAALRQRELAMLDHLQKKYQPATVVPMPEPITITPHTGEQLSLIA